MKRVTFITTGQPTTNPRLVKEAKTLFEQGYDVKVICCYYQAWAVEFDLEITRNYPGMFIYCGGDPVNAKIRYFITRLRQKACRMLFPFVKKAGVAENAISRSHAEALAIAKKTRSDIFVAHNLGALPAAVMAARYWKAKTGYDAEDMHSGQFSNLADSMYLLNKYIEEKYLPHVAYCSAASPLIAENYKMAYPYLSPVVINNVFPKQDLVIRRKYGLGAPLKLFWFSQTIGPDRGLELIIEALSIAKSNIELHLLGQCAAGDQAALCDLATVNHLGKNRLHFYKPISADMLFAFASGFDIGMASETGSTLNRDICLTNKIFTYLQCGLPIMASNTKAQKQFLEQYPESGKLYDKDDARALAVQLDHYGKDPEAVYRTSLYNYTLGQQDLNWEKESLKFISLINNI